MLQALTRILSACVLGTNSRERPWTEAKGREAVPQALTCVHFFHVFREVGENTRERNRSKGGEGIDPGIMTMTMSAPDLNSIPLILHCHNIVLRSGIICVHMVCVHAREQPDREWPAGQRRGDSLSAASTFQPCLQEGCS